MENTTDTAPPQTAGAPGSALCLPRRRFECHSFWTNNYGMRMFWPIPREKWWPYDSGWPPKGVEIRALGKGVWDITCPGGEIVELIVL